MEENKNKSVIDRVWDVFASVKLAVIIFSLIALTSIVGTVIEQQAEPAKNIKLLGKLFGESAAPPIYIVLDSLGFMNMYHSWWFVSLLLLFAANLIICSVDRLPRIIKLVKEKVRPVPPDYVEKMSIKRTLSIKGKAAGLRETALAGLKDIGFRAAESVDEKGLQLYAEKGNFTRLGVYITHLSILIILSGALIGVFFGFNAVLNLPEGAVSTVAYKDRGTTVPLGFGLRLDSFEVEFYGQSDMPKAYRSWLTVLKDGQEVMKKSIVVNDPLTFNGITFYQSNYGTLAERLREGILALRIQSRDGKVAEIFPRIGEKFTIPGTPVEGRIADFSPALAFSESGSVFTYGEMLTNPAVFIEFSESGVSKFSGWILKRYPETWKLPDGSRVEFLDYWGVEYTGLQVRKDPGVLIVYLGCIIMGVGLYITFFMSHRRIWVHMREEKNAVTVLIGASANRNRASYERKVEKLVEILGGGMKGEKR